MRNAFSEGHTQALYHPEKHTFPRWELDLGGANSCVQHSVLSILGERSGSCKVASPCSKGNLVGMDTKGKVAR